MKPMRRTIRRGTLYFWRLDVTQDYLDRPYFYNLSMSHLKFIL